MHMNKNIVYVMLMVLLSINIAQAKEWDVSGGSDNVAYLELPETVKVFEIDGDVQSNFGQLFRRNTRVKLAAGKHQIKLRYEQFFDVHPSHEIYKSDPVELFFTVTAGRGYQLVVPEFTDHVEGEKFSKNPAFELVDEDGASALFSPSFEQKHSPKKLGVATVETDNATSVLNQLQRLWQEATVGERAEFTRWIDQ